MILELTFVWRWSVSQHSEWSFCLQHCIVQCICDVSNSAYGSHCALLYSKLNTQNHDICQTKTQPLTNEGRHLCNKQIIMNEYMSESRKYSNLSINQSDYIQ